MTNPLLSAILKAMRKEVEKWFGYRDKGLITEKEFLGAIKRLRLVIAIYNVKRYAEKNKKTN